MHSFLSPRAIQLFNLRLFLKEPVLKCSKYCFPGVLLFLTIDPDKPEPLGSRLVHHKTNACVDDAQQGSLSSLNLVIVCSLCALFMKRTSTNYNPVHNLRSPMIFFGWLVVVKLYLEYQL